MERNSWLDAWVEAPSRNSTGGRVLIPYFTATDLEYMLHRVLQDGMAEGGPALAEAQRCQDLDYFWAKVYLLADLLAFPACEDAIQVVRQSPKLMLLAPEVVAERLVRLRGLLPGIDLHPLLCLGPWLLLEEDLAARVEPALAKLQALMPAYSVPHKLAEGGSTWWNFADLVREKRRPGSLA